MRMRAVAGLDVKPGDRLVLQPGGYHVMLADLKRPLQAGDNFPLTLAFEKAGSIEVQVVVESIAGGATTSACRALTRARRRSIHRPAQNQTSEIDEQKKTQMIVTDGQRARAVASASSRRARRRTWHRGQALFPGDACDRRSVRRRRAVAADDRKPQDAGERRRAGDARDRVFARRVEAGDRKSSASGFGATYKVLQPDGGDTQRGFDNLEASVKYKFYQSDEHETILSAGHRLGHRRQRCEARRRRIVQHADAGAVLRQGLRRPARDDEVACGRSR